MELVIYKTINPKDHISCPIRIEFSIKLEWRKDDVIIKMSVIYIALKISFLYEGDPLNDLNGPLMTFSYGGVFTPIKSICTNE